MAMGGKRRKFDDLGMALRKRLCGGKEKSRRRGEKGEYERKM
jgi:hypothetical protein